MASEVEAAKTTAADANAAAISADEFDRFEEEAKSIFLDFNSTAADRLDFIRQTMDAQGGDLTPSQELTINMLQDEFSKLLDFITSFLQNMKEGAMNVINNIAR